MDFLIKNKNYGMDDYPIINICFFIDIFITSIVFLSMYVSGKGKSKIHRERNWERYGYIPFKKEEKKGKLYLSPYDIFHPNETDKYHH